MKNILIPTDFSIAAWNATKFALHLFAETHCVFYFLNTYTPEINNSRFMADTVAGLVQHSNAALSSKKGLDAMLRKIKKNHKNPLHNYKTNSSFALLIDEVKETVIANEIDFIIMGANGSSENESIFMGSNTVRIAKTVHNCPVLAIPKNFDFKLLNNIAFITDFNRFSSGVELTPILTLAKIFQSSIQIATVKDDNHYLPELLQLNHQLINHKLEGVAHSFHSLTVVESFSKSLEQFITQFKCQLVVMSTIPNSYMNGLCRELVIEKSMFYSEVPVLLVQGVKNGIAVSQ